MLPTAFNKAGRPITVGTGNARITVPAYFFPLLFLILWIVYATSSRGTEFIKPSTLAIRVESPGTRSSLAVDPADYVSAEPAFKIPDEKPSMPDPSTPHTGNRVPSVVHYVFGLRPPPGDSDEGPDFPYWAYLSVRTTIERLNPDKIYFHYRWMPKGPWWDALLPHITLHQVPYPETIFGRPVGNYAHAADVIRMYAMQHTGGIYLDIDVFIIKPFDDFMKFSATMGMEIRPNEPSRNEMDPAGLCNGIIMSEPNSPFIRRWLDQYQTFDTNQWSELSVQRPWLLARQNPGEVQVLGPRVWFYPLWNREDVERVHTKNDYDFYSGKQYAYHAYESQSAKFMDPLTPDDIRKQDTSFKRLLFPLVRPEDDKIQKAWARHRGEA